MIPGERVALLRGFMGITSDEFARRLARGDDDDVDVDAVPSIEARDARFASFESYALALAFGISPGAMAAYLRGDISVEEASRPSRASWDEYFMRIATTVASRATCDRKHVGAVIERSRNILATGYNGSVAGLEHCDEVGHMMEDGHCVRTIHAENNAIIQAARNGARIEGASIYVTASPCWQCFKMIANAGIRRIVFGEFYRDQRIFEAARRLGIDLSGPSPVVTP